MVPTASPLISLLLVAALSLLAACSNNPHPAPLHSVREDGKPWRVTYGNISDNPRSLDPQVSYDTTGNTIISQIYESLLQYNLFKTDPYELEPCLADGMPREIRHADGRVSYEVRLKRGIRFHDDPAFPGGKGRELTAADFVYTFQRIADPKVECPVLSVMQEFVVGLKPAFDAAKASGRFDYSRPIDSITVIDDHTFQIHLLKPYPQFFYWLAMPFTAPVAREVVEYYHGRDHREQFRFHPVGTGPFRLAEWARGRLIRLERNPHYITTRFPASGWPAERDAFFRPLANAPLPLIDEAQYAMIKENVASWLLFRQGYLDRVVLGRDNFGSAISAGLTLSEAFRQRGVQLNKDPEPVTFFFQFNMDDPVVGKNRKLRQALSTVYDGERANILFRNGVDINAQQLLPPGLFGYQPDFRNPYRTGDVAKARELIAEAGYPGGIDPATGRPLVLKLDVVALNSVSRQRAEFDQQQFEQLGIRCEIVENTWPNFQDRQIRGTFQMNSGSGWHADYPDAETFFLLFDGRNLPPEGHNASRFQNARFDALFQEMSQLPDGPERLRIAHQLNDILVEECPLIPTSHLVLFSLDQPWMRRLSRNALLAGGAGNKYAWVDPAERDRLRKAWNRAPLWPTFVLAGAALATLLYAVRWVRRQNV